LLSDNPIALKTISKAVTKQIGKTLTAIGESPEIRSLQRLDRRESLPQLTTTDKAGGNEQADHDQPVRLVKSGGKSIVNQFTSKQAKT
jgi:hypothetical protein